MTLKPTDIRIGNWVKSNGVEFIIENGWQLDEGEPLEPIELTEEGLIKLWFELTENEGDVKYFQLENYGVKSEKKQDFYFYKGEDVISTLTEILYVHQLQNIYHALTGEELTIKDK